MKIRMKTLAAGPDGVWPAGREVDLPEAQALALIQQGYAEPVTEKRETAAVEPSERAVTRQEATKRRKRGSSPPLRSGSE